MEEINQILHNYGIGYDMRYRIVCNVIKQKDHENVPKEVVQQVKTILQKTTINKNELCQIVFMFFGNKYFKKQLDQFYTPMTICEFICKMLIPTKIVVDPACGTGDLISCYNGFRTMCDRSKEVLELTRFIHNGQDTEIIECDSLRYFTLENPNKKFDYCIMNPPFGSKTVITDQVILNQYIMGANYVKQEIGLLFIELGLKILKKNGFLFAIVPNGYLGNCSSIYLKLRKLIIETYKVVGIIELPVNSFSRSGTGVSTSILIIKNQNCDQREDYPIFISQSKTIGYVLNKKNTPIKYKIDENGNYVCNENNDPFIDNDLESTCLSFKSFLRDKRIDGLDTTIDENIIRKEQDYSFFMKNEMDERLIMDIKRFLPCYKNMVLNSKQRKYKQIKDYCQKDVCFNFSKTDDTCYEYIDISSVSSPLYRKSSYYSHDLPSRAKNKVEKGDILISKLKGNISFTIITEENNNLVVSNGFCVVRPLDDKSRAILFAFFFTSSFQIQHQYLVTGSIMETISNQDIMDIYVEPTNEVEKFSILIDNIYILNNKLLKIRNV